MKFWLSTKHLQNTELTDLDFSNKNLEACNFRGSKLFMCIFESAHLEKANFKPSKSRSTVLDQVSFFKAHLNGACFKGVDLTKVNLDDADLSGADLRGASLPKAANIKLSYSKINHETKIPFYTFYCLRKADQLYIDKQISHSNCHSSLYNLMVVAKAISDRFKPDELIPKEIKMIIDVLSQLDEDNLLPDEAWEQILMITEKIASDESATFSKEKINYVLESISKVVFENSVNGDPNNNCVVL